MRILSRYVLKEFLTPVMYCFLAFASLHLIFELFGEFDKILQTKPPFLLVLRYIGGFLAKDLQWLVTPSLLLGSLYAMWQLARHSEITAMRASGIGFSTITAPMLCAAAVCSCLSFLCSEYYAPFAIYDSDLIKNSNFKHGSGILLTDVPYNNVADRRDWQISHFYTNENVFDGVRITWTNPEGYREKVLEASRAKWNDHLWWFDDPVVTTYERQIGVETPVPVSQIERDILVMPELTETPRDFIIEHNLQGVNPEFETLSVRDMAAYLRVRPNLTGPIRNAWHYEIINRFTAPLACIFITLLAIPAGVATGRQSVFAGVVMAILLFIGYYALTLFCGVQAKSGVVPIWLGVAFPNVVILTAGLVLFHKQR